MRKAYPLTLLMIAFVHCLAAPQTSSPHKAGIQQQPFGTREGRPVHLFTLTNAHGLEVKAMNYGAIITSIRVPDRKGQLADIALGHDTLEGYIPNTPYLGAVIGRYAGRINHGSFTLDGKKYSLPLNNGTNTLHGGIKGFDKVVWDDKPLGSGKPGVVFSYLSKDGEEGFPGNLKVKVTYTLTDADELVIDYEARTDKATPLNLTQHTYFNLAGEGSGDVLNHEVAINGDRFTPVGDSLIPTGEIRSVKGTPLDFTTPTKIGARIGDNYEQMVLGKGYDHSFLINREEPGFAFAARVYEPASGRVLEVSTTEPVIHFYTGNFLDGTVTGKQGHVYRKRDAFCLETQHFPDSPNHPEFPSAILRPGETYRSQTVFKFSAR